MRPLEQMEDYKPDYRPERPQLLGFACMLWFVSAPLTMFFGYMAYSNIASHEGISAAVRVQNTYTLGYIIAIGVGLAGVIGLWNLRRWGMVMLTVGFGAGQILLVLAQAWEPLAAGLWLVPLAAGAAAWRSLR